MKITMGGVEIPFREYLVEICGSGSGALYDEHIKEILMDWKTSDWAYVDDYIGHIAAQVIIDASEVDRELYNEIMELIEKAYSKLWLNNLTEYEESEVRDRRRALHVVKNEKIT